MNEYMSDEIIQATKRFIRIKRSRTWLMKYYKQPSVSLEPSELLHGR